MNKNLSRAFLVQILKQIIFLFLFAFYLPVVLHAKTPPLITVSGQVTDSKTTLCKV
jgi:hypothetical protein